MNLSSMARAGRFALLCVVALATAACGDDKKKGTITDPVPTPSEIVAVSAGHYHSCGITDEAKAYCWGYNSTGQLADGSTDNRSGPVAVLGDLSFMTISGGGYHTCGVTTSGAAYCWGKNDVGQLGNGSNSRVSEPVAVTGGLTFSKVIAGENHACGIATDGVYCWGANNRGQLGNGTTVASAVPTKVAGDLVFASLKVGYEHTCGLTSEGAAYCWGKNSNGQIGDGTRAHRSVPTAVTGGITFLSLGSEMGSNGGQNHTCGIASDNTAYCWGDNWHNQAGVVVTRGAVTTPQPVVGAPPLAKIAVGGDHSCGLTATGEAWCWGDATRGQLGHADALGDEFHEPVEVEGDLVFTDLSLGWDHTCGLSDSGEAFCWGYNGRGQMGTGNRDNGIWPQPVVFE